MIGTVDDLAPTVQQEKNVETRQVSCPMKFNILKSLNWKSKQKGLPFYVSFLCAVPRRVISTPSKL